MHRCCRLRWPLDPITRTQLTEQHRFSAQHISEVRMAGGEVQRMLCEPKAQKRAPQTIIDAKFSLPFTVAIALLHDEVSLSSFTPATLQDASLLALASKSRFELKEKGLRPQAAAGDLSILLAGGKVLHDSVSQALGCPERPLDDAALHAKFMDCASRAARPLARAAAERLAERILTLERELDAGAALTSR
jgi:2-methylcitrate dehydratase PrpD